MLKNILTTLHFKMYHCKQRKRNFNNKEMVIKVKAVL